MREVFPHHPTSPNATDLVDIGLGFTSGILAGADKLTRISWLRSDLILSESVRGIEVWREYNGRAGLEGVIKDFLAMN